MKKLNILSRTEVRSKLYQPRRTIRLALEILKMNPTITYFLSLTLKLASNQLHTLSSNWCQGSNSKLKGITNMVLFEVHFSLLKERLKSGQNYTQISLWRPLRDWYPELGWKKAGILHKSTWRLCVIGRPSFRSLPRYLRHKLLNWSCDTIAVVRGETL